jgi:hypothetical protein
VKTAEAYEAEATPAPAPYGLERPCLVLTRWAVRQTYARRHGPIPRKLCVCHKCDVAECIEDSHHFLGSHEINMHDATMKGKLGTHMRGRTLPPEHCGNISKALKGRPLSTEHKMKAGAASGASRKGKPLSEAHKEALRQSNLARRRSL